MSIVTNKFHRHTIRKSKLVDNNIILRIQASSVSCTRIRYVFASILANTYKCSSSIIEHSADVHRYSPKPKLSLPKTT